LTQVRAQTAAPQLEAQLAQALVQSGASPVTRLMRIVGRFIAPDNQDAWLGLSTYLRLEGDPALLARVLTFRDSQSLARENALHADTVLRQLAAWDASAVRGLHAAYQIRRNLTTERIANLFANFEPEQGERDLPEHRLPRGPLARSGPPARPADQRQHPPGTRRDWGAHLGRATRRALSRHNHLL